MNSDVIDAPDYYRLPDGTQLEDAIWEVGFGFAFANGSALKYLWRAGRKDGESREKDMAKFEHYVRYVARRGGCDEGVVRQSMRTWLEAIENAHGARKGGAE